MRLTKNLLEYTDETGFLIERTACRYIHYTGGLSSGVQVSSRQNSNSRTWHNGLPDLAAESRGPLFAHLPEVNTGGTDIRASKITPHLECDIYIYNCHMACGAKRGKVFVSSCIY